MRRLLLCLSAVIVLLALATSAAADPISDYRRTGSINPCKYSPAQLRRELNNLPPDVQQYAPGLADQLNQGRQGCNKGSANPIRTQGVPAPAAPGNGGSGGAGAARVPDPPAPTALARTRLANLSTPRMSANIDRPTPGWVLPAVLAALLAGLVVSVMRMTGVGSGRLAPLGTAFSEAGARTAESMTQFWDRVRLGR